MADYLLVHDGYARQWDPSTGDYITYHGSVNTSNPFLHTGPNGGAFALRQEEPDQYTTYNKVVRFDGTGAEVHTTQFDGSAREGSYGGIEGNGAAAPDGSFYYTEGGAGSGALHKVNPSGGHAWSASYSEEYPTNVAVGPDGDVYSGSYQFNSGGECVRYTSDGSQVWKTSLGSETRFSAVGADYVYFAQYNNIWKLDRSTGTEVAAYTSPVRVGRLDFAGGHLYVGGTDGAYDLAVIAKMAPDGTTVWEKTHGGDGQDPYELAAGPTADTAGDVYYTVKNTNTGTSTTRKVTADGTTTVWSSTGGIVGIDVYPSEPSQPNQAPTASFAYSESSGTVDFTDQSSDGDGTIQSWSWDFGDGNTSTQQNPTHSYATSGTYTASLTVTDDGGATATATQDISVTVVIGGTASVTDKGPATDSAGTVSLDGSAALTDQQSVLSTAGVLPLSASLSLTNGKESFSSAGGVYSRGTGSLVDTSVSINVSEGATSVSPYFFTREGANSDILVKRDSRDGLKIWEHDSGSSAIENNDGWAADQTGNAYYALNAGSVVKLNSEGTKQWEWDATTEGYTTAKRVALKPGGNVIAVAYDSNNETSAIVELSGSDGSLVSTKTLSATTYPPAALAVDKNGGVYWGRDSTLRKLDSSLTEVWAWNETVNAVRQLETVGGKLYAFISTGTDPVLYDIYRIDASTGETTWKADLESTDVSTDSFDIGADSSQIYVRWTDSAGDHYSRFEDTGTALALSWTVDYSNTLYDLEADRGGNVFVLGSRSDDDTQFIHADSSGYEVVDTSVAASFFELATQPLPPAVKGTLTATGGKETLAAIASAVASASGSLTSRGESIATAGGPYVSADGSLTGGKEAYASAGRVLASGPSALTDNASALSAAGTPVASGSGGAAGLGQILAVAGTILSSAQGSLTGKAEALAIIGGPLASGSAQATSKGEALTGGGDVSLAGQLAHTNAFGNVLVLGDILASGGGSLTSAGETIAMLGDLYAGGTGDLAFTDAQSEFTAAGDVLAAGATGFTDGMQGLSSEGVALLSGTSSIEDQGHVLTLGGRALASGQGGFENQPTVVLLDGAVTSRGDSTLALVDGLQTVALSGGPIAGAAASLTDNPHDIASEGGAVASSSADVSDGRQALVGSGLIRAGGSLHASNPPQYIEGDGVIYTSGALSADDGRTLLTITTFVGRKPDSISIGVDSIITVDTNVQSSL